MSDQYFQVVWAPTDASEEKYNHKFVVTETQFTDLDLSDNKEVERVSLLLIKAENPDFIPGNYSGTTVLRAPHGNTVVPVTSDEFKFTYVVTFKPKKNTGIELREVLLQTNEKGSIPAQAEAKILAGDPSFVRSLYTNKPSITKPTSDTEAVKPMATMTVNSDKKPAPTFIDPSVRAEIVDNPQLPFEPEVKAKAKQKPTPVKAAEKLVKLDDLRVIMQELLESQQAACTAQAVHVESDYNSSLNIYQRINAVMKKVGYLKKDDAVSFGDGDYATSYQVVTHDAVSAHLRDHLISEGIDVSTSVIKSNSCTYEGAYKKRWVHYEATYEVSFINIDSPDDKCVITIESHADDQGDKAPGKALSYATKYALLKKFQIETGESDEARNHDADKELISAPHYKEITKLIKQTSSDTEKMLGCISTAFQCQVNDISHLTIQQYQWATSKLNLKAQKLASEGQANGSH